MPSRSAKSLKIVLWVLAILVLVVAAALVAGKYWLIPSIIRGELGKSLANVWDGTAEVGDVEFNYFGPVRIASLRLIDRHQRTWVETAEMEFRLGEWPSANPVLRAVHVGQVNLRAHVREGRADWPFRKPPPAEEPVDYDKYLDLQDVSIGQISLGTEYADGRRVVWRGLALAVERQGGEYQLALRAADGPEEPLLAGTLGTDLAGLDMRLRIDQDVSAEAVAAVLDAFNIAYLDRASGHIRVDITADGALDEIAVLRTRGEVELSRWSVAPAGRPPLEDAGVLITLNGQRAAFTDLSAGIAGLTVTGQGAFDAPGFHPGPFWAEFHVHGPLNLDTLALFIGSDKVKRVREANGRLDADVTLSGHAADEKSLSYGGTAHLKQWNVAFHEGPALRDLSATVGLEGQRVTLSDLSLQVDELTAGAAGHLELPGWKPGRFDANVTADGPASADLVAQLLTRAGVEAVRQASGGLHAQVGLSGEATDLEALRYDGTAELKRWSVDLAEGPPLRQLSGTFELGPDQRLHFRDVSAQVGDLRTGATGHLDLPGWKPRGLTADVTANGLVDRQTMAYVLKRAGVTAIREASGTLDADVELTGDMADTKSLTPKGTAILTNWTIVPSLGPAVERFSTALTLDGRNVTASDIAATVCKGAIVGSAATQEHAEQPLTYSGSVTLTGLDVAELARSFDPNAGMTRGRLRSAFTFRGDATGIDTLEADGNVHVTEADFWNVPLVTKILTAIGRTLRLETLSNFDADVVTVRGREVRVPDATAGHGIAKIELDTIRVHAGEKSFSGTAVLVPGDLLGPLLGQLEQAIGRLGTALLTRLTGFRIEGSYAKPHKVSVVPLPVDTVRRLGTDFLKGIAGGGEEATGSIRDILDTTLQVLEHLSRPKEDR